MTKSIAVGILGALVCGLLLGCGGPAPAPGSRKPPPVPKPAPVSKPIDSKPIEAPAPPKPAFVEQDPIMLRLALSADVAKKINALAEQYDKKRTAMDPETSSRAERQAVTTERDKKIREELSPEQQAKYDAGVKPWADFKAEVTKLQKETSAKMYAIPTSEMNKRAALRDEGKAKRAALDADLEKKLDELVGKLPAGANPVNFPDF
jgi:hypothetical protein